MKKILGIFGLLVAVFALTWAIEPKFASAYNCKTSFAGLLYLAS